MKNSLLVLLILCGVTVSAQIETPAPSPLSTIEQKVGLSDVSITYSRPSVKGRTIFGDLVQYGEMWRWGANASTKFTTSDDIKIEGTSPTVKSADDAKKGGKLSGTDHVKDNTVLNDSVALNSSNSNIEEEFE